jgi:hypothetical protein
VRKGCEGRRESEKGLCVCVYVGMMALVVGWWQESHGGEGGEEEEEEEEKERRGRRVVNEYIKP